MWDVPKKERKNLAATSAVPAKLYEGHMSRLVLRCVYYFDDRNLHSAHRLVFQDNLRSKQKYPTIQFSFKNYMDNFL